MGEMINFGGGVRMEMGPFARPKTEKCAGLYYRDNQGPNYSKHVSRTTNTSPSYNFSNAERYVPSTSKIGYDLNREGTKGLEYERPRRDRYDQRNTY